MSDLIRRAHLVLRVGNETWSSLVVRMLQSQAQSEGETPRSRNRSARNSSLTAAESRRDGRSFQISYRKEFELRILCLTKVSVTCRDIRTFLYLDSQFSISDKTFLRDLLEPVPKIRKQIEEGVRWGSRACRLGEKQKGPQEEAGEFCPRSRERPRVACFYGNKGF